MDENKKDMNDNDSLRLLVVVHKLAVHHNLIEGVWNHISFESTENKNHIIFTPGHTHWDLVSIKNLAKLDQKGDLISGEKKPISAAWMIHKPIHAINPNYKCLIHLHSPYITSMSINNHFETRLTQHSSIFHNDVNYFDEYIENVDESDLGELMAESMKECRVLFLKNHGALISGSTIAEAYMSTYMLERACMFQLISSNFAKKFSLIPEKIVNKMKKNFFENLCQKHFNGFVDFFNIKLFSSKE